LVAVVSLGLLRLQDNTCIVKEPIKVLATMMSSLWEYFPKKSARQPVLTAARLPAEDLEILYESFAEGWLEEQEKHPVMPLALTLVCSRLIYAFLQRQAPNDSPQAATPEAPASEAPATEAPAVAFTTPDTSACVTFSVSPTLAEDPTVKVDEQDSLAQRTAWPEGVEARNSTRIELSLKVEMTLRGYVNDILPILQNIPMQEPLAFTTIVERLRDLLLETSKSGMEVPVLEDLLSSTEENESNIHIFRLLSEHVLEWTAEILRCSTEAYHDCAWLCDQMDVTDRRFAWKAAVLWKTIGQAQLLPSQTYPTRRYALLAASAAVGLFKLRGIVHEPETKEQLPKESSEESETEEKEPPTKRPRLASAPAADPTSKAAGKILEELAIAARKEAAYTRWIGGGRSGRWKIAVNLSVLELRQAIFSLTNILVISNNKTKKPTQMLAPLVVDEALWWQTISLALGSLPPVDEWERLVDDLYLRQLAQKPPKTFTPNVKSFDEFGMLEYARNVEDDIKDTGSKVRLVEHVAWDVPMAVNPLTTAVVSRGGLEGDKADNTEQSLKTPAIENIRRRSLMPTVISESMELNEWIISLLSVENIEPTAHLVELLDNLSTAKKGGWKDILPKVVNRALLLLLQESLTEKVGRKSSVSINVFGKVSVAGDMTHDKALCKAVVVLYYHALEAVLMHATSEQTKHPLFYRSILSCCMACVVPAMGATHKISPQVQSVEVHSYLKMTENSPMSFLLFAPLFREILKRHNSETESLLLQGLPLIVQREFMKVETAILDTLLWSRDPTFEDIFADRIEDFMKNTDVVCCWWPVQSLAEERGTEDSKVVVYPHESAEDYDEFRNISDLIDRVLQVSDDRFGQYAMVLGAAHWRLLAEYSRQTFRQFLREHVKLFFDRHLDHWILTTLYGVGKRMKLKEDITFAKIIEAYV
jgi:hypothetical protein